MTHGLQFLDGREHFLRVDMTALRARMLADVRLSADERQRLHELFELAAARLHFEYHRNLERLKAVYAPYDPDRESPPPHADADTTGLRAAVGSAFGELLVAANYAEMPRGQIEACLTYDSRKGLADVAHGAAPSLWTEVSLLRRLTHESFVNLYINQCTDDGYRGGNFTIVPKYAIAARALGAVQCAVAPEE